MEAKRIIEAYYDAWTRNNLSKARTFLDDNITFSGSIDKFSNADDFMKELSVFTGMVKSVKLIKAYFDEKGGVQLYDVETISPAGTIRTAEFFSVTKGKISDIKLIFDATELRKLMSQM
jgi:hypothetical protein